MKINKNKNMYIANTEFIKNCLNTLFFRNNLESLVNSINDNEKIHIEENK